MLTRPLGVNGYGFSPSFTHEALQRASLEFKFVDDTPEVFDRWLKIVATYTVLGLQARDAYHVAAMNAHGITKIMTLDKRDFLRHKGIEVVMPHAKN